MTAIDFASSPIPEDDDEMIPTMTQHHEAMRAEINAEIEELREEIRALRLDVQDLMDAWRAANGVVRFVKWVSSLVVAVGVLWVAAKELGK